MTDEEFKKLADTIKPEESNAVYAFIHACCQVQVASFIVGNTQAHGSPEQIMAAQGQLAQATSIALSKARKVMEFTAKAMEENPDLVMSITGAKA